MDTTKQRILEAATEIFVRKGFSGASITDIARSAGINQSLIYHHIGNKQDLWKEIKRNLIESINDKDVIPENLEDFIKDILTQRIEIYEKDPRILRIIQWQMLEDQEELVGGNQAAPFSWINSIEMLQGKGEIRTDYQAPLIAVYIHSLINGLLFDSFNLFSKNMDKKAQYIKMIHQEIIHVFKT